MEIVKIPFNKPFLSGQELEYINDAITAGHISGNGKYTKKCQAFFENKWGFKKCLLTTSCTDALEMTAMLMDIKEGDEIIVPSYTFVSSALVYARIGAKIVFADSLAENPNMDCSKLESLINSSTKAIVVVHYAGISCDMDKVMELSKKYGIYVVEDAAQAIDSFYKGKPLGSIGHFGCFSFHETKNIQCGEGGLLTINDDRFIDRSEILWEKGTNRSLFFRGIIDKYGWVDIGSSFLPSDMLAAYLYAQLENIDLIQAKRIQIWERYYNNLEKLEVDGMIKLPKFDKNSTNNAHMFYITCADLEERTKLISYLKERNILSVFHYQSLHKSTFIKSLSNETPKELPNAEFFDQHLLRLPLYYELSLEQVDLICENIYNFYK